jgi:hypothetical protein
MEPMSRLWQWDTKDAEWSVELDEQTGVLRWRGADKPRPGVPAYAQGGGEVEQRSWDLVTTGRPAYECPPAILVDVLSTARSALPPSATVAIRARVAPLADASIQRVLRICQVAVCRLTATTQPLTVSVQELEVEEVPDDRPTQSSMTRTITGVRIGDRTFFQCTEEYGGWSQGTSDWLTVDFAGFGRLHIELDKSGVSIEGAPAVVEALSNAMLMNTGPDDSDEPVHERAAAVVRSRFAATPSVIWDVTSELCREGVIVSGRASRVAYHFYVALLPPERFFILHVVELESA